MTDISVWMGFATTIIVAVVAPLLLAMQLNRSNRAEKQEDYKRQDEVAAKAATVAKKAEETAHLLLQNDKKREEQAKEQGAAIERIHVLVNSNLTTALSNELISYKLLLVTSQQMLDLKKQLGVDIAGDDPTVITINETSTKVAEMEAQLRDRQRQTDLATAQFAAGLKEPKKL